MNVLCYRTFCYFLYLFSYLFVLDKSVLTSSSIVNSKKSVILISVLKCGSVLLPAKKLSNVEIGKLSSLANSF